LLQAAAPARPPEAWQWQAWPHLALVKVIAAAEAGATPRRWLVRAQGVSSTPSGGIEIDLEPLLPGDVKLYGRMAATFLEQSQHVVGKIHLRQKSVLRGCCRTQQTKAKSSQAHFFRSPASFPDSAHFH
jgi:hypothetical protein